MSDSQTFSFKCHAFFTFFLLEDDTHVYKAKNKQFT